MCDTYSRYIVCVIHIVGIYSICVIHIHDSLTGGYSSMAESLAIETVWSSTKWVATECSDWGVL